jgi:hypothetical protein
MSDTERTDQFILLDEAAKGEDLTVRDDQNAFIEILDAAKVCRLAGGRFRLLDTGRFSLYELEWLGEAGADIYTSDEARLDKVQIDFLAKACAKGDAIVAYFHYGEIDGEAEGNEKDSLEFLKDVGRSGVHIHLTNREIPREIPLLCELAYVCQKARTRLVYYHLGPPSDELVSLARSGAWIHLPDQNLEPDEESLLPVDLAREAAAARGGLILHIERGLHIPFLREILKAGAYLLVKTPPSDYRSPSRILERRAAKRVPDFRSYYLYDSFMP